MILSAGGIYVLRFFRPGNAQKAIKCGGSGADKLQKTEEPSLTTASGTDAVSDIQEDSPGNSVANENGEVKMEELPYIDSAEQRSLLQTSSVVVEARRKGGMILYDITNIQKVDTRKEAADGVVPSTNNGRGSHVNGNFTGSVAEKGASVKQQFSFGGRNAATADLNALRRAQEMERAGVAEDVIFRDTGWYTGADGKWRFEIDDSGMKTDTKGSLVRNPDVRRYRELYMNTAGEIEARDTARRRPLTAEERRNTMPDTGNEDTVFTEMAEDNRQYSISETEDGRAVAVVDDDILSHIDTANWDDTKKAQAKKAAKTALLAFKDGVQVNGIAYKVNKVSRDEFTRSNDTERLYRKEPEIFADKLRASANADDIIIATTSWANDGKLTHPRTDNLVDFAHGEVLIQAGTNQYEAETVVGITDAGEHIFYDVVDMEPTSFKVKEEPSTAATGKDAESAIQENSSGDSVAENGLPVKQQFSLSEDSEGNELTEQDEAYLAAVERGDMEEAQRMVDDAAYLSGYDRKAYHGTDSATFNVFDSSLSGKDHGTRIYDPTDAESEKWRAISENGFSFATTEDYASMYGNNVFPVYLMESGLAEIEYDEIMDMTPDEIRAYVAEQKENGYDGIYIADSWNGNDEVRIFDPWRVKSAAPVTYDDTGNIIPLSQRFNAENEDIRYSFSEDETEAPMAELPYIDSAA